VDGALGGVAGRVSALRAPRPRIAAEPGLSEAAKSESPSTSGVDRPKALETALVSQQKEWRSLMRSLGWPPVPAWSADDHFVL